MQEALNNKARALVGAAGQPRPMCPADVPVRIMQSLTAAHRFRSQQRLTARPPTNRTSRTAACGRRSATRWACWRARRPRPRPAWPPATRPSTRCCAWPWRRWPTRSARCRRPPRTPLRRRGARARGQAPEEPRPVLPATCSGVLAPQRPHETAGGERCGGAAPHVRAGAGAGAVPLQCSLE